MIRFQADLCIIINYDSCRIVANHEFPTEAPSCKSQEPTVEVPALKPSEPREQRPVLRRSSIYFRGSFPPRAFLCSSPLLQLWQQTQVHSWNPRTLLW